MRYDAFISYSHAADGKLAPALQHGLHRFARPWNRMRALRVYRDTASQAATPELWPSIVAALEQSAHFLLLASPQAAASKWVQREVEWWFANRPADKFFVLLTAGTIAWDEDARDFDWKLTTALPDRARGKFQNEPLYVDLTWADRQDQLSLQNTRFRQAILDIAAPLHGKDKDQLDGEDVRHFRRARRLRTAAVAGLVALALASATAAVVAVKQRDFAIAQARIALSRQLAAEALASDTRLDVALLLAAAAHRLSETPQARAALQRLLTKTPTVKGILASDRPEETLAFSPDGRLLASAPGQVADFDDDVVSLWSTDELRLVGQLRPTKNRGRPTAIAFHPDGKRLAVGYVQGGEIIIWDVARIEPTGTPLKSTFGPDNLAFSPDGRNLLSSTSGGVMLWDTTDRQLSPNRMPRFAATVRELTFSPDGTSAAATSNDGVVIWDIKSGQIASAPRSFGGERITAFAFHPDGTSWLFGTSKGVILYDAWTREVRREWKHELPLRDKPRTLRLSTNGNVLVIKGHLGAPEVVDPEHQDSLGHFKNLIERKRVDPEIVTPVMTLSDSAFALSPDGHLFAQSLANGAIVLWNFGQRRSFAEVFDLGQPRDLLKEIIPWQARERKIQAPSVVLLDTARRQPSGEPIRTEQGDITALAFSPNNRTLATGGRDGTIVFWDLETRRPDGEPPRPSGHEVERLAFSPDGKLLASVSVDRAAAGLASRAMDTGPRRVTLWDVASRQAIDHPFGERPNSDTLGFSSDGRLLMSAGDGKVLLYDVEQRKLEAELTHGSSIVDSHGGAVFSVDGRTVFSLSKSSLVAWDIASRRRVDEPVRTPLDTADHAFRLSPDGKLLALLSSDGLRLFDAATRQLLMLFKGEFPTEYGHAGFSPDGKQFVVDGVFSPDGKWLASRANYPPRIWHIDIERWLAQACELVNRNLTSTEWRRFAGSDAHYVRACPDHPGANAP